jgi:hypothetical protein
MLMRGGRLKIAEKLLVGELLNGVLVHASFVSSQFLQFENRVWGDFHRRDQP